MERTAGIENCGVLHANHEIEDSNSLSSVSDRRERRKAFCNEILLRAGQVFMHRKINAA